MIRALCLSLLLLAAGCGLRDAEILSRALDLPADVGPVCGISDLLGREIGDVDGGDGGCGISDAVKVYAVGGVALNAQPRINCRTATALHAWATGPMQDAARENGTLITDMRIVAGYACRRRNNRRSGRLSEHARGNAVDIAAFTLKSGEVITLPADWKGRHAALMQALHASACGPFGTVLGPKADVYHQDHFHFDTAAYRSGPYCR